ncbi:cell division cycle-associated protein 3 [Hyalella azteca]|uniref:Cell division cycle-associated protein 3 n=1 Tax=Hyalella azteca TaxID=294128 RepID=A0A8B7N6G2_HYAAZ|nr:cell division cycle-associated protein 3 [Hyalella azteca]
MGLSSSKSKTNSANHVKSSDGNSSCPEEDVNSTPLRKVLPFDPRSPTDHITRTPITVTSTGEDCTPARPANPATSLRVLDVDPRSPSQQVTRTPIVIDDSADNASTVALSTPKSSGIRSKPHALNKPDESPTPELSFGIRDEENDPRSPSVTVPRTPLEDKLFKVSIRDANSSSSSVAYASAKNSIQEQNQQSSKDENNEFDQSNVEDDKENKESSTKDEKCIKNVSNPAPMTRSPLSSSNKTNCSTPRNLLQAKQCRTIEEEFTKNQRNILAQINAVDEEVVTVVPSTTQFVEQI